MQKRLMTLWAVATLLILTGVPASATEFTDATLTVTCRSYTITATGDIRVDTLGEPITIAFVLKDQANQTIATWDTTVNTNTSPDGNVPFSIPFSINQTGALGPLNGAFWFEGVVTVHTTAGDLGKHVFAFSSTDPLSCPSNTGCPGTPGFWKNAAKHPFPASVQASGLTIGGVQYTAAQLMTILQANGGDAVTILGKQLVAARLNKAAAAIVNPAAEVAITTAEALLSANSLNLLTSDVDPSTTLGQALIAQATVLAGYNNANFQTCVEGSGLIF